MTGVSELIALCSAGAAALRAGVKTWKKRLSDEEKELLAAAAERPEFHVIDVEQRTYPIIKAGGRALPEGQDELAMAKFWDALRSLCERGAVEHVSGGTSMAYLRLTGVGLEQARKLAESGR